MIRAAAAALAALERRPWTAFMIFAAAHAAIWTFLPVLLFANLPLDLIEALVYGREWQLGYAKLTPLPWWIVEATYRLVGADAGYYLVAQIAVLGAFACVFALARPLVGPMLALLALFVVDGFHYFGFTAPKFNHDVIQLPFWALAGLAFHRALRTRRLSSWGWLGAAFGLAFWAKYFAVMLMAPMALFLLIDRDARRALATPGPYVAAAVALLVAAPHLVWLVQHHFEPFAYAQGRAIPPRGLFDHVLRPGAFVLGQLAWALPALLIAAPLFFPRARGGADAAQGGADKTHAGADAPDARAFDAFDLRIVTLLAWGPFALLVAASIITGRFLVTMWGYPLWLFLGLWIVMIARPAPSRQRTERAAGVWLLVTAGYILAFIADYGVMPQFDQRYRAATFPGDALARTVSERYRAATGEPLAYVIGSYWLGGNISHYSKERPRVVVDAALDHVPWIDPADLRRRGGVIIWADNELHHRYTTARAPEQMTSVPPEYAALAAGAVPQPPFTLPSRRGLGSSTFGWAILPPQPPAPAR